MTKNLLAILFLLLLPFTAQANDSEYFAIGNQLVPLKQTTISVANEVLKIKICNDGFAEVDVHYVFDNKAGEQTLLMGFETCTPYFFSQDDVRVDGSAYIKDFKVVLNGTSIKHQVAMVEEDKTVDQYGNIRKINWKEWEVMEEGYAGGIVRRGVAEPDEDDFATCAYAYYFNATFKPGRNELHHHYRYQMGNGVDFRYSIDYKLSPAMRWANGQIDDFTLVISAEGNMCDFYLLGNLFPGQKPEIKGAGKSRRTNVYDNEATEFVLRNATATYHVKNFRTQEELGIMSASGFSNTGWDIVENKNFTASAFVYEPVDASYFSEMERGDIARISKANRHIIRNLPFAARGHVFKTPALADFFKRCWWYMPDPTGKDMQAVPMTSDENTISKKFAF